MRQRRRIGGLELEFEAPEAGRYEAPILLCPGLFQSFDCWRPLTSMLAHRGWEVYFLGRSQEDLGGGCPESGWAANLERISRAAAALGDKTILFGADIGAAMAVAAAREAGPLALALFAPARPRALLSALRSSRGMFEAKGPWRQPPRRIGKLATKESSAVAESAELVEQAAAPDLELPKSHPPALVFAVSGDPLVTSEETALFAAGPYSEQARTELAGRWWPETAAGAVADEVHRYLILTLGDRVVEFPEEILADD